MKQLNVATWLVFCLVCTVIVIAYSAFAKKNCINNNWFSNKLFTSGNSLNSNNNLPGELQILQQGSDVELIDMQMWAFEKLFKTRANNKNKKVPVLPGALIQDQTIFKLQITRNKQTVNLMNPLNLKWYL